MWPGAARIRRRTALGLAVELVVVCLALTGTPPPGVGLTTSAFARLSTVDPELAAILEPDDPNVLQALSGTGVTAARLVDTLEQDHLDHPIPEPALWNEQRQYGDASGVSLWVRSHSVEFQGLGFAAWEVPADPKWNEDPFSNVSWLTRYQGLGWLMAVAGAYESTHQEAYLSELKNYLLSWIRVEGDPKHASKRAWYDHAVALRTDMIVYLLETTLNGKLSPTEYETVLKSLAVHADFLDQLLNNPAFDGHNHRLFHAMALYNLSIAFPELRGSAGWKAHASRSLTALLDAMVSPADGVELEQAISYHYVAMTTFETAADYLRQHDEQLAKAFDARVRLMSTFGAAIISPDGTVPAIGDTNYGAAGGMSVIRDALARGLGSPIAEFIATQGQSGQRPPDLLMFPVGGYAILRPSYGDAGPWVDDLQAVMDVGPAARVHGHQDGLSVDLAAYGAPLLVDPGGPYLYGSSKHDYFVSAEAHNSVVLEGLTTHVGSVHLLVATDTKTTSVVEGQSSGDGGYVHTRTLVLVKPDTLVVVDRLTNAPDGYPAVMRYHLPPQATVTTASPGSVLVGSGGAWMRVLMAAQHPLDTVVHSGGSGPNAGWVTPAYDREVAAPVITASQQQAGWFVTVISPGQSVSDLATAASVMRVGDGFRVQVSYGTRSPIAITIGDDGSVSEP